MEENIYNINNVNYSALMNRFEYLNAKRIELSENGSDLIELQNVINELHAVQEDIFSILAEEYDYDAR